MLGAGSIQGKLEGAMPLAVWIESVRSRIIKQAVHGRVPAHRDRFLTQGDTP